MQPFVSRQNQHGVGVVDREGTNQREFYFGAVPNHHQEGKGLRAPARCGLSDTPSGGSGEPGTWAIADCRSSADQGMGCSRAVRSPDAVKPAVTHHDSPGGWGTKDRL